MKPWAKIGETLCVRPGLRNPPWLVQHPTLGVDDDSLSVRRGTLLDATKQSLAKRHPPCESGCSGVRWTRLRQCDLPLDAAKFLVDYGYLLSKDSTSTNILETWRSTRTVEAAFQRTKATPSGRSAVSVRRLFEVVNVLFKGRWSTCMSFERSYYFFKDSQKVMITRGLEKGKSVWDCFAWPLQTGDRCLANVSFHARKYLPLCFGYVQTSRA